ncbi:MAG: hypothetical protein ACI8TQ_003289 [Planctomycetota bacterium]|jgi:hypothetical protein
MFSLQLMLACLPLIALPLPAPQDSKEALPKPAVLQKAFDRMKPGEQLEIVEFYRHQMGRLQSLQLGFVRHVIETQTVDVDPGIWPTWSPAPFYDPEVHAPGQPIPRKRVDADDSRTKRLRSKLLGPDADRRLWSNWTYNWSTGEVNRIVDDRNVERAFHNALEGFAPDLDLAEALLERWLDDGEERERHAAFGHNYTDRSGNAFEGITLYDAWSSGEDFETPDLDILGLVHDLENEWKRWKAPISPYQQRKLYEHVAEDLFLPAHRHRGIRTAMARIYLVGDADMRDNYNDNLDRFHALWEHHGADPEKMLEELPSAKQWEKYLKKWVAKCKRDKTLMASAQNRRWALNRDQAQAYATLVWVMREAGAIE